MARPDLDDDMDRLLGGLETVSVQPPAGFRDGLTEELGRRLALRRGDGELPADWALCPFDRFCVAEQPLPHVARANCPCLRGAPLLRLLKARGMPVHARPCAARRLGQGARAAAPPAGR